MRDDGRITFDRSKKFDIQLGQGLVYERRLAEIFSAGKIERLELKSESWLWERTGNLAIEFQRGDRGSGITTTEADYWVHELCREGKTLCYLMFPIDRLRDLVAEARLAGNVRIGGDDELSHLALIKIADLLASR